MHRKPRIHYTETGKTLMWDHWQKGESLNEVTRHSPFSRSPAGFGPNSLPFIMAVYVLVVVI